MKKRFRLIRRNHRGGQFYCLDTNTGKRTSLHTKDPEEGGELLDAKNRAASQPILSLQIAKAYLTTSDPEMAKRAWQVAMDELMLAKLTDSHCQLASAMRSWSR